MPSMPVGAVSMLKAYRLTRMHKLDDSSTSLAEIEVEILAALRDT